MPYRLKLTLYLLTAALVAIASIIILSPLGTVVSGIFAPLAGYLTVLIGRRVMGVKNL